MKMNMKKIISWGMMLAAAFTLTNCAKEIENPNQQPEVTGYPFEIIASTVDTKTVNDGVHTNWSAGDQINLIHAAAGTETYVSEAAFTIAAEDLAEGRFTGTLKGALTDGTHDWYVLYPYSSYTASPEKSGYLPIGCEPFKSQVQIQEGNGSIAHIAGPNYPLWGNVKGVGHDEKPELVMSHVSSLIKVVVTNATETPLTVENIAFTAPVDIVGTYYINFAGETVECTNSGTDYVSKTATLNVNNGEAIESGMSAEFYLAVRPFTAEAGSSLTLAVNGYSKEPKALTNNVTFHAGKIKTLNFAYDYVAPAGEQSVTFDFTSADELIGLGVDLPAASAGTNITTLTKGDVTFVAEGGSTETRVYNSSGKYDLRAYKGATLTFSAPSGYVISDVVLTGSKTTSISTSVMPSNPVVLTVDANAETQKISTITVKYVEGEVEMTPLTMSAVTCTNSAPNSLTFTWGEVSGAAGYKVSIDGGETYGDILTETSYTWVDLEPETEYTLYVKAIGNGLNTSDSEAVSCTETTDEELVGVEEVEAVIDLTNQGYSNQQEVSSVSKNPIDVVFNKGSNSNAPKYYTSGTAVRLYGGGYFTVSSDKTIVKVVITFGSSDGTNEITTDSGAYSNGTWTGNANSVKFSIGGTSGNRRIQKITVTYQKAVGEVILESRDLKFSSSEVSATMGQAFTAPTLSGVTLDVKYTSSNTDVATVDATTGVVTLVAVGTTTITASAPATAEYEAGDATYTLTVAEASSGPAQYTYTCGEKQWSAAGNKTLGDLTWNMTGTGGPYFGYDGTKGQQFGSGNNPYTAVTLSTSDYAGAVSSIKISTSGASSTNATIIVKVNGVQYGNKTSLTSSNKEYTFTTSGNVQSGKIEIIYSQTSKKAIYIKTITIN